MNKSQWKGKWRQLRGNLKKAWGTLMEDDVAWFEGDYERFLGKIQAQYGTAIVTGRRIVYTAQTMPASASAQAPSNSTRHIRRAVAAEPGRFLQNDIWRVRSLRWAANSLTTSTGRRGSAPAAGPVPERQSA